MDLEKARQLSSEYHQKEKERKKAIAEFREKIEEYEQKGLSNIQNTIHSAYSSKSDLPIANGNGIKPHSIKNRPNRVMSASQPELPNRIETFKEEEQRSSIYKSEELPIKTQLQETTNGELVEVESTNQTTPK